MLRRSTSVRAMSTFETFKYNNFPECDVNGFGSRFHPKDLGRLVGKASVESNRSDCDSHCGRSPDIYIIPLLYIRGEGVCVRTNRLQKTVPQGRLNFSDAVLAVRPRLDELLFFQLLALSARGN